jgi:hypothetical protein
MTKLVFLNSNKGRADSSNMNFLIFTFLGLIFGLPGSIPDPDSQSGSADPIESGSETLFFSNDCAVQVRIQKEQVKEERQKFLKKKESLQNVEIKKKSATGIYKTFNPTGRPLRFFWKDRIGS